MQNYSNIICNTAKAVYKKIHFGVYIYIKIQSDKKRCK